MQRKLVKQGAATLMVSLPAKWAQKNNLDKGDVIDLTEDGNSLTISVGEKKETINRISLDISGMHPLISRSVLALFIRGADEIEITFKNIEEVKEFQRNVLPELLGFEIIKQTQQSVLLKDVTGCEKQEIDELIKRIFLVLDSILEEFLVLCEKKGSFDEIIEADRSVNRLTHFCLRVLNKKGYPKIERTSQIYGILNQLEETGDSIKRIAKEANNCPIKKEHKDTIKKSREMLKNFSILLFSFDHKLAASNAKLFQTSQKEIKGKSLLDAYCLQLMDMIIRINNYLLVFSL